MKFAQKLAHLKKGKGLLKDAIEVRDKMLTRGAKTPAEKRELKRHEDYISVKTRELKGIAAELKAADRPRAKRPGSVDDEYDSWTKYCLYGSASLGKAARQDLCEFPSNLKTPSVRASMAQENGSQPTGDRFNLDAWEKSAEYAERYPDEVAQKMVTPSARARLFAHGIAQAARQNRMAMRPGASRFQVAAGDGLATDEAATARAALGHEEIMGLGQRLKDRSGIYDACKVNYLPNGRQKEIFADTSEVSEGTRKTSHAMEIEPVEPSQIYKMIAEPWPYTSKFHAIQANTITDINAFDAARKTSGDIFESVMLILHKNHTNRPSPAIPQDPTGLVNCVKYSGLETAAAGTFAPADLDNLIQVVGSVPERYLNSGSAGNPFGYMNSLTASATGWMMRRETFFDIHALDNAREQKITIKGNLMEGIPNQIHGYPVIFNTEMDEAGVAGSNGKHIMLFGPYDAYEVFQVGQALMVNRYDDSNTRRFDQIWFEATVWSTSKPTRGITDATAGAEKTEAIVGYRQKA